MKPIIFYLLFYLMILVKIHSKLVFESSCSLQQIYHTKNNFRDRGVKTTITTATTNGQHSSTTESSVWNSSKNSTEVTSMTKNSTWHTQETVATSSYYIVYLARRENFQWTLSVLEKWDSKRYKVNGKEYYKDANSGETWYVHDNFDSNLEVAFKKCYLLNKEIKANKNNGLLTLMNSNRKLLTYEPGSLITYLKSQLTSSFLQNQVEFRYNDRKSFDKDNQIFENNIEKEKLKKRNINKLLLDYIQIKKDREDKYNEYRTKQTTFQKLKSSKRKILKKVNKVNENPKIIDNKSNDLDNLMTQFGYNNELSEDDDLTVENSTQNDDEETYSSFDQEYDKEKIEKDLFQ